MSKENFLCDKHTFLLFYFNRSVCGHTDPIDILWQLLYTTETCITSQKDTAIDTAKNNEVFH